MRRPLTLVVAAFLVGCGADEPDAATDPLRTDALTVLDWSRARPAALCETREAAAARPGRELLQTPGGPDGQPCFVAVRPTRPVVTGADVATVEELDDGRRELRFDADGTARLAALGDDSHVGVVLDGRLLDVVFPAEGRIRVTLPGGS